jgi:predicted metal-dependent hydrolase
MVFKLFSRPHPTTERLAFEHRGQVLSVLVKRRSNAKRLTLRVRDGEINLTTPPDVNGDDIKAFIIKHFGWITVQLNQEEAATDDGMDGVSIWFKGVKTPIRLLRPSNFTGRSRVEDCGGILTIYMAEDSRIKPSVVLENWLKEEARQAIKSALDDVLPILGQSPVPLSIRDQKTRWGSCSTTRRLSFNWRLIMAPPPSLHYVVVHEAVHLIHHDHSKRFWAKVEEVMPDFRIHQQWLKSHQRALFAGIERRLTGLTGRTY